MYIRSRRCVAFNNGCFLFLFLSYGPLIVLCLFCVMDIFVHSITHSRFMISLCKIKVQCIAWKNGYLSFPSFQVIFLCEFFQKNRAHPITGKYSWNFIGMSIRSRLCIAYDNGCFPFLSFRDMALWLGFMVILCNLHSCQALNHSLSMICSFNLKGLWIR